MILFIRKVQDVQIKTEATVVIKDWGMGNACGVSFCGDKMFWNLIVATDRQHCEGTQCP